MTVRRLRVIGSWHTESDPFTHPQALVDALWDGAERQRVVEYLSLAPAFVASGIERCLCGCVESQWQLAPGVDDPSVLFAEVDPSTDQRFELAGTAPKGLSALWQRDDRWCWPEAFVHYVSEHAVRPPREFIAHVRKKRFASVTESADLRPDFAWWAKWCRAHAPFEREQACPECQKSQR